MIYHVLYYVTTLSSIIDYIESEYKTEWDIDNNLADLCMFSFVIKITRTSPNENVAIIAKSQNK